VPPNYEPPKPRRNIFYYRLAVSKWTLVPCHPGTNCRHVDSNDGS